MIVATAKTSSRDVGVIAYRDGERTRRSERVAEGEPLEIRLRSRGASQRVAVTMRTPRCDLELAAGFVLNEHGTVRGVGALALRPFRR